MRTSGFLLYRLNLVDRGVLFQKPISHDEDIARVFQSAAHSDFDVTRSGRKSSYRWALREVVVDRSGSTDRPFIVVTFTSEVMSRRGPIVTPEGISRGFSTMNPPPAVLVRIVVDLARHVCAIEDVPSVMQVHASWRNILQMILNTAAWKLEFSSMIRFSPVVPEESVAVLLKSFDRVTRLRVTLRIPNPDLGPSFRQLKEEMERSGIRELTQDMRNERGLNVAPETLPQAALDMAATGYRKGKIHVYGVRGGKNDELTIADDVARIESEDLRDYIEGYAEGYSEASRSVAVKRFASSIIQEIDERLGKKD